MMPVRKNLNKGKYFGETIDTKKLFSDIEEAAREYGWSKEVYFHKEGFEFQAYTRKGKEDAPKVYISSGIHGDEPAGPLAALQLMKVLPNDLNLWLCPILNPLGLSRNQRENEKGIDLNRDYKTRETEEVKAHVAWIEHQPLFDLTLCLHEDWEAEGFYLYTSKEEKHAEAIVEAVKKIFPIDSHEVIEGFDAKGGILRPGIDRARMGQWPEAFYLRTRAKEHYTFEVSSDYELSARVDALVTASLEACRAVSLK
jgi:murein peptide amidase A